MKSSKKFFISETCFYVKGDGKFGKPQCYKRFETREEAESKCRELNEARSKEATLRLFNEWGKEPSDYSTYRTYEVRESK